MAAHADVLDPEVLDQLQPHASPGLMQIALRRKALLVLGLLLGLGIGTVYYTQKAPAYRSTAQVLVSKKRPAVMPVTGFDTQSALFEDYLSTHQVLIKSPLIVRRAVDKHKLEGLRSFEGQGDPTAAIILNLFVGRDSTAGTSNNILNLAYRGPYQEETGPILNAVLDSYKDFLEKKDQTVSEETRKLLSDAMTTLQRDLVQKQKELADFRKEAYKQLGDKTPLLVRGKDGVNPLQERLNLIASQQSALRVRKAQIEARRTIIAKYLKEDRSRAALLNQINEWVAKSGASGVPRPSAAALEDQLLPLLLQQKALEQEYGPGHPLVDSIKQRIQLTRDFYNRPAGVRAQVDPNAKDAAAKQLEPVEIFLQSLSQDMEEIALNEQKLDELFKAEYDEAKKLTKYELELENLTSDVQRTRGLVDTLIKQLREVNLVSNYGVFDAQVIAPAGMGWKVEPNAFPVFSLAVVLGLLGGWGLAYLAEISDKSFRTPDEIRRRLGLQVVGHIPFLTPAEENPIAVNGVALDPILVTYHHPKSVEAESYRGVRTALYFSTLGGGHKVVQVTSPNVGDGKTTLTANLAISIAQSGKRCLLIDADLRRPRLHKLFGLTARSGLASVIAGQDELEEAVQKSVVPGLWVLPAGPLPPNPAELLTSPRFKAILDSIREQTKFYDFVLLDTPPLLRVTDPCVVAPRADGVLLTLRIAKNGRPYAERAKEILSTLGAKVVGVVVNGVGDQATMAGHGYDHYSSGYVYADYTYDYRADDDAYYSEKDADEATDTVNGHAAAPAEETEAPAAEGNGDAEPAPGSRGTKPPRGLLRRLFNRR